MNWTTESASDWVMWDHCKNPPVPKLPKEPMEGLVEFIRDHREEVVQRSMDRYLRCPPEGIQIPKRTWPKSKRERLCEYCLTQVDLSNEVKTWVYGRFIAYTDMEAQQRMPQVAVDLISWQWSHKPDPVQFIIDLE